MIDASQGAYILNRHSLAPAVRDAVEGCFRTYYSWRTPIERADRKIDMPRSNSLRKMVQYHELVMGRLAELDDVDEIRDRLRFIEALCRHTLDLAQQVRSVLDMGSFEASVLQDIHDLPSVSPAT